jgi:hypothetical protein
MDVPEATGVPPQEPVNQSIVSPAPTVPESVAGCASQIVPAVPSVGVAGTGLTVTVTEAQAEEPQEFVQWAK